MLLAGFAVAMALTIGSASAAVSTYSGQDVELSHLASGTGPACSAVEAEMDGSPRIALAGFRIGPDPVTLDDTTVEVDCAAATPFVQITGGELPVPADGGKVPATIRLEWPGGAAEPNLSIDMATTTQSVSVSRIVSWMVDITDADPSTFDSDVIAGILPLQDLDLEMRWTPTGPTTIDVTGLTTLVAGTESDPGDDIAVEYVLSYTAPSGGTPTLLAGLGLEKVDATANDYSLGALVRGAIGDLAAGVTLPDAYLATVQPAGQSVTGAGLRPAIHQWFDDHGPDPTSLPADDGGTDPFSFDNDVTIAADAHLDSLGEGFRSAFGYAPGSTATLVGDLGVTFAQANDEASTTDLTGVDVDILLPDVDGASASLIPDWLDMTDPTLNFAWRDGSFKAVATTLAGITIDDPSQDTGQVSLDFDIEAAVAVADGDLSLAFTGTTPAATEAIWEHPFGQAWLDLHQLGVALDVTVPAAGGATVDAALTSKFDIGGKTFDLRATFESQADGTTAVLQLELHDQVGLQEVLANFGSFPLPPSLSATDFLIGPDAPGGTPVRVTARLHVPEDGSSDGESYFAVNAPATIRLGDGADAGELRLNFLFSIHGGDTPTLLIGGRTEGTTTLSNVLGDVLPDNFFAAMPAFDFELPTMGLVFAPDGYTKSRSELPVEEDEFFRWLHGCGGDPAPQGCDYRVALDSGAHFLSAVDFPKAGDGTALFGDVLENFWMDPANPPTAQLKATIPGGGTLDFNQIGFQLKLPVAPPAQAPDWFHHANLAIGFGLDGGGAAKFNLLGNLGIRIADEEVTTEAACGSRAWELQSGSTTVHRCYDVLDFTIDTELTTSATGVELIVAGSLDTTSTGGWHPFGLDWLRVDAATLQLGLSVDASGQPQVSIGMLAAGALFDKDFSGSLMFAVRVVQGPPYAIPVFQGIRFASQAGVELADLVDLYEYARSVSADQGAGLQLPDIDFELQHMPNVSLRNVEIMVALANAPRLCLETGFRVSGALYLNAEPLTAPPAPVPGGCHPGPLVEPQQCLDAATEPCFAAALVNATADGLIVSGGLGAFEVGPLRFDQAGLDLRFTPTVQRFKVYGGATLDGIAKGQIDLTIGSDGMAFVGDIAIPPDALGAGGGSGFRAKVEGEFAVDLSQAGSFFDDPGNLLGVDFWIHAVLQADFSNELNAVVAPFMNAVRSAVVSLDAIYDGIKVSDGDVVGTLRSLPAELRARGIDVPLWLENPNGVDFVDALATMEELLASAGLGFPTLGQLLTGVDIPVPGVPGFILPSQQECRQVFFGAVSPTHGTVRDGKCWTWLPNTWFGGASGVPGQFIQPHCWAIPGVSDGTWVGGTCYMIPPSTLHLPGACNLVPGLTCDFSTFLEQFVEPPLVAALNAVGVPGTDFQTMVDTMIDRLSGTAPPMASACIDFEARSNADVKRLDLRMDLAIFAFELGLVTGWDFTADPASEAGKVLDDIVASILGAPADAGCKPLGQITVAGGGAGAGSTQQSLTDATTQSFSLALDKTSIDEGESVVATGTFTGTWEDTTPVAISWGDGATQTSTVGALKGGVAHTFTDDDPTGSAADVATVIATTGSFKESRTVTIRNVAPSTPSLTISGGDDTIAEGETFTLSGTFTDPGGEAGHTVEIDWGDGTPKSTVAVAGGARSFSATHVFVDDDPTGTPSDDASIAVTVTDDDSGAASATKATTIANVAPSAIAVAPTGVEGAAAPTEVTEGHTVAYEITFTDPGVADTHEVTVDWGDGTDPTTAPADATGRLVLEHLYVDDDPTATPSDDYTVTVTVDDDDTGATTATRALTVHNADPTVDFDVTPVQTVENRDGVVTVTGEVADAGREDTHTVTIDWGYAGFADTVVTLPAGAREFQATSRYGDNGTFPITVSVVDDDTGTGSATHSVVVDNADPTALIEEDGAFSVDGGVTFIVRHGDSLLLAANAADVGSDDLTFSWDWDATDRFDPGTTQSAAYLPPGQTGPDGLPTPEVKPNAARDTASHTWSQPCVYEVTAAVTDDDGGTASDTVWVVVTGTSDRLQVTGWWSQQYLDGQRNKNDLPDVPLLSCYLEITRHMSAVFGDDDPVALDASADARTVLDTKTNDPVRIFDRHLLVAWLNFSHGAHGWTADVDTDCDRNADTRFEHLVQGAETARLDPSTTKEELASWKNRLECASGGR